MSTYVAQILNIQYNSSLSPPCSDLEARYSIASETRNNLVAASQNIQGAQRYLSNVQFPYCAPSEVETLNKVRKYIFILLPLNL